MTCGCAFDFFPTQTLVRFVQVHPRASGQGVYACVLIRRRGLCWCAPLQLIAVISNQRINVLPASLWREPAFSIFLWPAMRYANKNQHCAKSKRDNNYWKRFIFWRICRVIRFVNPFFIKNVCSLDHKALYMCLRKTLCPALSWFLCIAKWR